MISATLHSRKGKGLETVKRSVIDRSWEVKEINRKRTEDF